MRSCSALEEYAPRASRRNVLRPFCRILCGGLIAAFLLVVAVPLAVAAPAIYPVDTASFLSGAHFDFKVELDSVVKPADVLVRINGKDAETVLEGKPQFIEKEKDAKLIVTGDHTHALSVIGTVDDTIQAEDMRDKVGVYDKAGYPNYVDADGDGYPDRVDVSKRLAAFIGNFPDHYETYAPKMNGPFVPAVQNEKKHYVANEAYKNVPGAQFRPGNLPRSESTGVHAIDDLVLHARGPGAEKFRGFMDSTEVFRIMAESLALGTNDK